ncbi:MAG: hypothetical protein JWO02_2314 [Solirubrobacterales bacterium]|nr:hypothetical protein [Solirubrobacterales bacterium]
MAWPKVRSDPVGGRSTVTIVSASCIDGASDQPAEQAADAREQALEQADDADQQAGHEGS